VKKLMLLVAAGTLWLFLAAIPALADGGPHTASSHSGVDTLTSDSCAGCHRAHTAQGARLINQSTEEGLCLSCHGSSSLGATADVLDGVQYAIKTDGSGDRDLATKIGALRGGGFENAYIGEVGRVAVSTAGALPTSVVSGYKTKVTVATSSGPVTSAHLALAGTNLDNTGTAWGNGTAASGVGPVVEMGCTSCHNPHGNGQYRILNTVPTATAAAGSTFTSAWSKPLVGATGGTYTTVDSHALLPGDTVTITANSNSVNNGTATVLAVNINTFTLTSFTVPMTGAGTGSGGIVTRTGGVKVKDYTNPAANDTRNYTVIQTQAGVFYTSQMGAYNFAQGDYFHRQVPWNAPSGSTADAPNGVAVATGTVAGGNYVPAFNDQINTWCAQCHTRYMSLATATNATGGNGASFDFGRTVVNAAAITAVAADGTITSATHGLAIGQGVNLFGLAANGIADGRYIVATVPSTTTFTVTGTFTIVAGSSIATASLRSDGVLAITAISAAASITAANHGLAVNDVVFINGLAAQGVGNGIYSVAAVGSANAFTVKIHEADGTYTAVTEATANAALTTAFVKKTDSSFAIQHRVQGNRACTTCHVAHGSNRVMTGDSGSFATPAGVASDSSRLLKVDNRGTCQACHDESRTWTTYTNTALSYARQNFDYQGAAAGVTSYDLFIPQLNVYKNAVVVVP
jgi:predicted CXXCH cytochrome family protein